MSLHDDIMNIQRAVQKQLSAAAKMAIKADAEIERLKAENAKLRAQIEAARPPLLPPIDPDDEEIVDNIFRRLDGQFCGGEE